MTRTFTSATAFRQALEQRLKNVAAKRGVPLHTLRLKIMMERLLARLFARPNPPWLLKGGFAMELRYRPHARTTKDIDLGATAMTLPIQRIRDQLQAAAEADLRDFVTYRIGDALSGKPERLRGDDLLAFAGLPPAEVLAIPGAQQFAEKIHAYTYPWTDRPNTRSRDLVDLMLLIQRDPPSPGELWRALQATFETRGTHAIPDSLIPPPSAWAAEFKQMAEDLQLETTDIGSAYSLLVEAWRVILS